MIVDFKTGKINVKIQHNSKAYIAYMLIKFKTSEEELLSELLRKFKNEKFIGMGTNLNNKCQMIKTNINSLYATIPDGKILQFITLLYRYILNMDINNVSISSCLTKNQSYNKLHDDVKKGFDLYITGKCKNLENKFIEKNKQIKNFSTVLSSTPIKKRDDIKINKDKASSYYSKYKISENYLTKLYFCIFYQEYDFHFSNDGNEIMINQNVAELMNYHMKENKKLVQGYVKAFMTQLGNVATKPSRFDKNGEAMKKRNKIIIDNINMLIEMVCEFYNLKYNTISNIIIEQESLTNLKKIILK